MTRSCMPGRRANGSALVPPSAAAAVTVPALEGDRRVVDAQFPADPLCEQRQEAVLYVVDVMESPAGRRRAQALAAQLHVLNARQSVQSFRRAAHEVERGSERVQKAAQLAG